MAIRTGQYLDMNCSEVYSDEIVSYNPITGEIIFVDDFSKATMRNEGNEANVAGFYAWFKLSHGFYHGLYMTKKQVENHAKKYSKAYQYDLDHGKKSSRWSLDFIAMGEKTVIKRLLSKWGILSIEMQRAMQEDQKVYDANGAGYYEDNPNAELTDGTAPEPALPAAVGADFEQIPQETADAEMESLFEGEEKTK